MQVMRYDPDIHHRRSIRLKGYDYSMAGAYFVTTCVQGRECLFGAVADGVMHLNEAGRMIRKWWLKLPDKFPDVAIDEYVIMPNHFHGIITIVGAPPRGRPVIDGEYGRTPVEYAKPGRPHGAAPTVGNAMNWFKTMTTNAYIKGVKTADWLPFHGRLWQRNYHERIIRSDAELDAARKYIGENPLQWDMDTENPANLAMP